MKPRVSRTRVTLLSILQLTTLKAAIHLAIITIITIAITAIKFLNSWVLRYHVLITNRFYYNLTPHTRKKGSSLKKILLAAMSVILILRRQVKLRKKTKAQQERRRKF